jgi:hypothetical protein
MIRNLLVMAPLLCLAGCLTQNDSALPSREPGLQLIAISDDLASPRTEAETGIFDLGNVDGSVQQYFILQNTGDAALANIQLSTDNPNLTFSPSTIETLAPSKGLSIVQVIKLNVVHGRRLDAEGWGSLLPKGKLQAALTVTAAAADSAQVRLEATVRLNARVMDAELYNEGTPFDFSSPNLFVLGGSVFPGSQTVPVYTPTGEARLVNTGNVPLLVRRWESAQAFDSVVVAPGAFYPVIVESFEKGLTGLELEAYGVVSDPAKFRKNIDGRFFFRVTRPIGTVVP